MAKAYCVLGPRNLTALASRKRLQSVGRDQPIVGRDCFPELKVADFVVPHHWIRRCRAEERKGRPGDAIGAPQKSCGLDMKTSAIPGLAV